MSISQNSQNIIRFIDAIIVSFFVFILTSPITILTSSGTVDSFSELENLTRPWEIGMWLFLLGITIFYIARLKERFRIIVFAISFILQPILYNIGTSMPFNKDPNAIESIVFAYSITLAFLVFPILHILTNIFLIIKSFFQKFKIIH